MLVNWERKQSWKLIILLLFLAQKTRVRCIRKKFKFNQVELTFPVTPNTTFPHTWWNALGWMKGIRGKILDQGASQRKEICAYLLGWFLAREKDKIPYFGGIWKQRENYYASYLATHGGCKPHWQFHASSWAREEPQRYLLSLPPMGHGEMLKFLQETVQITIRIYSFYYNNFKIKLKIYLIVSNNIVYI